MKCACGTENDTSARFCEGCGAPILPGGRGSACACGAAISPDDKFCLGCGKAVGQAATPLPQAAPTPAARATPAAPAPARRSAMGKALPIALLAALVIGGTGYWWLNRSASPGAQDVGVYPFRSATKMGLVDAHGQVLQEPAWDNVVYTAVNGRVVTFSEGLLPVVKDNLYGFLDVRGQVAIPLQYNAASAFSEGLAAVSLRSSGQPLWGFIDKKGRYVINPQFRSCGAFHDGLAAVETSAGQGFVDRSGSFVIKPERRLVHDFSEGLAGVRESEGWGFLDRTGKMKIRPQFQQITGFSEGLAAVRIGDKWGYCNQEGKLVINPQFESATPFLDGLAVVGVAEAAATINKDGRFILQPSQHNILASPHLTLVLAPYLPVQTDAGMGLMTRTGQIVVQPTAAIDLFEHVYAKAFQAQVGGTTALVTWEGTILTGPYKGSNLTQAVQVIAKAREEAIDRDAADKVTRAGELFQQGQYQVALGLCDEVIAVRPAHEGALKLKEQIGQTLAILGGK